jgi:hypothetical protein
MYEDLIAWCARFYPTIAFLPGEEVELEFCYGDGQYCRIVGLGFREAVERAQEVEASWIP